MLKMVAGGCGGVVRNNKEVGMLNKVEDGRYSGK